MTTITFDYNTAIFRSLGRILLSVPMKVGNALYKSYKCARAETELENMDPHLLADIGITRGEIHSKVWGKF